MALTSIKAASEHSRGWGHREQGPTATLPVRVICGNRGLTTPWTGGQTSNSPGWQSLKCLLVSIVLLKRGHTHCRDENMQQNPNKSVKQTLIMPHRDNNCQNYDIFFSRSYPVEFYTCCVFVKFGSCTVFCVIFFHLSLDHDHFLSKLFLIMTQYLV